MRRRDFLGLGVIVAGSVAARRLLAQVPAGVPRAAVVIGVDRPGNLPVLKGAASGAAAVAEWLRSENFEVKPFTDTNGPVLVHDIFSAVKELVDRATLGQLVVYFAGHGFLKERGEIWLLSEAPTNPGEAISMGECVYLATYQSGIPNVVFISDACRSIPNSIGAQRVNGTPIFPDNEDPNTPVSEVDLFLAALPGQPALEVPVDESSRNFEGIYTGCFLDAFRNPDAGMVLDLPNGERVVPNRKLKGYLLREVRRRSEIHSIQLRQDPDTHVVSEDETYIGHVSPGWVKPLPPPPGPIPVAALSLSDVATFALQSSGSVSFPENHDPNVFAVQRLAAETGFTAAFKQVLGAGNQTPADFEAGTDTGFVVTGAPVAAVASNPATRTIILNPAEPALIRVEGDAPAGSIALRFEDGSGTVVAVLPGFVGNIVVDGNGVSNVSYVPARSNWRWSDYQAERGRLDELRAAAAASAQYGVFRIEGENREASAEALADRIRVGKGFDPTLGIYAAYAYSDAGLPRQVHSVRDFMRGDLEIDVYDVAMLDGAFAKGGSPAERLVPFCPMLSQGWGLMRVKNAPLAEVIASARDHLRPALWTSFDAEGMEIVMSALANGSVQ